MLEDGYASMANMKDLNVRTISLNGSDLLYRVVDKCDVWVSITFEILALGHFRIQDRKIGVT